MDANARRIWLRAPLCGALMHWGAAGAHSRPRPSRERDSARNLLGEHTQDPVLVLVHGALADMAFWLRVIPLLNEQYTVISYTLHGHHSYAGERDPRPAAGAPAQADQYTLEEHASDLLWLLQELRQPQVHLVGHDIGASIALRAAVKRPEAVASLTLSNVNDLGLDFEGEDFRALVRREREIIDEIDSGIVQKRPNRALQSFLRRYVGDEADLPHWAQMMYAQNAPTLPLLVQLYRNPEPIDAGRLERLKAPVHLLSGLSRQRNLRPVSAALSRRLSQAELSVLPGGHLAPIAWPHEFCDAVRSVVDIAAASGSRDTLRT